MMRTVLIGIVIFREKYWETVTFKKLLHLSEKLPHGERITIFIFDNTDLPQWDVEHGFLGNEKITVFYTHDSNNPGISKAYNQIAEYAKDNQFSHIVFLDQDTDLPQDFLSVYQQIVDKDVDIAAPLIYENGKLLSPGMYKNYRSSFYKKIEGEKIELKDNSCINSGLLIKTDFFYKVGGYNESLRLDFCDHEFIKRVGTFTKFLNIIPVKLEQNFSTNTNPQSKALFRYALFTKDIKSFKRIHNNDFRITLFVDLPHLIRLTLQYKSLAFIKQRFC